MIRSVSLLLLLGSGCILSAKAGADLSGECAYENLRDLAREEAEEKCAGDMPGFGTPEQRMPDWDIPEQRIPDLRTPDLCIPDTKKKTEEDGLLQISEARLKKVNPDYAAWILIPDTPVDYPAVAGTDNQIYLKRAFDGKKRACGSLFFDAAVQPFTSLNTVIHGHNMKSGAMFGTLSLFLSEEYGKSHARIYLFREGRWICYRLLAVYTADSTDPEPYRYLFYSWTDFLEYVESVRARSEYRTEETEACQELLTLSTCRGKEKKLILQWGRFSDSDCRTQDCF